MNVHLLVEGRGTPGALRYQAGRDARLIAMPGWGYAVSGRPRCHPTALPLELFHLFFTVLGASSASTSHRWGSDNTKPEVPALGNSRCETEELPYRRQLTTR